MTSRGGSLLKMSMFVRGELKPGIPTLYIDLDSSIHGDVARLADCLAQTGGLYLLARHAIPHCRFRRLMRRVAPNRYYLGNTAIMAFDVADEYGIANRFLTDFLVYLSHPGTLPPRTKRLYDEGNARIISEAAHDVSRVFPKALAVKFTQEYMSPALILARLHDLMPWLRARRRHQVAVSYQGEALKPEKLVEAQPGDIIRYKHYRTRWSYDELSKYWKNVLGTKDSAD